MVRMNLKLSVEEDSQWKMFINMDNSTGTNGIIKEGTIRGRTPKDVD
jgi:hypothetical protein